MYHFIYGIYGYILKLKLKEAVPLPSEVLRKCIKKLYRTNLSKNKNP